MNINKCKKHKGKNKIKQRKQRKPSQHTAETLSLLGSSKAVLAIQEILHFSWEKKFFTFLKNINEIFKKQVELAEHYSHYNQ